MVRDSPDGVDDGSKKRRRPIWQKVAGACLMLVGIVVVILNAASKPSSSRETFQGLPGGYNALYIPLGIAVTVVGAWWTGVFDRK